MRAAVLRAYQDPLHIQEVTDPEITDDGVVVEVEACGVCRSDWHAWQGHALTGGIELPHVLGHEPAGTVVEVGDAVASVGVGDRVVIPFNLCCGRCGFCRNGHENLCDDFQAIGFQREVPGAFAESVHVPNAEYNAIPLPDGLDAVDAAGMGCRFMTAFHALTHRAGVTGGDVVAVYGVGGVGLSAVHIGAALGATMIAVDLDDEKLERAAELGATHTVNASEGDPVDEIQGITDGGADVSMDAVGDPEACRNSIASLGKRGRHLQVGVLTEEVTLPVREVQLNEIDVSGSRGMQPSRFDEIFGMVESGKLDPGKVVSRRIALDEVADTLDRMTDYDTLGVHVVTEFS